MAVTSRIRLVYAMMKEEERKFDDVLIELGEFGRYQIWLYNLLCLFQFIGPWQILVFMFLSGEADHWCKVGINQIHN